MLCVKVVRKTFFSSLILCNTSSSPKLHTCTNRLKYTRVQKFISCFTNNTVHFHCTQQSVHFVEGKHVFIMRIIRNKRAGSQCTRACGCVCVCVCVCVCARARARQNAYFLKFTASGTHGCHWTSDSQQLNTYVSVSTTAPTLTKILLAA